MESIYRPVCPRCDSEAVEKIRLRFLIAIGIVCIGLGAWLLSLPLLGLIFFFSGGLSLLAAPFLRRTWYCHRCRHIWKYRQPRVKRGRKIIRFPRNNDHYFQ